MNVVTDLDSLADLKDSLMESYYSYDEMPESHIDESELTTEKAMQSALLAEVFNR